jgi:hypothetical protein
MNSYNFKFICILLIIINISLWKKFIGISLMQNEITKPSELLDEKGVLVQKGWARKLLLRYDRSQIKAGWSRIKEWDYYAILNPEYGITFTIADLGYIGLIAVVWLDFVNKNYISDEIMVWFPKGRLNLPSSSDSGEIVFSEKGVTLNFNKEVDLRNLSFDFPDFNNGKGIKANLVLYQDPNMDTMVIATPWEDKPKKFYYNQKINCMPAQGFVQLGNQKFDFVDSNSYAVLDWGRGVWPYKNTWYWGSASGKLRDGSLIGWNIGYGFGDTSAATENIVYYNGVGHKLDQVIFHFDPEDYLKRWKFTSNDGRFEMTFKPLIDRNSKMNFLVLKSMQHQVFGYFFGYFVLDDGRKITINRLLGFAEEVFNKW